MAEIQEAQVLGALKQVIDPDLHRDIVTLGFVKGLVIEGTRVAFTIELTTPACPVKERFRQQAEQAVREALPQVTEVAVTMSARVQASHVQDGTGLIPGVKNVVAVASGKGGVGKSTTAVNLALALAATGASVGILDADVYGPSLPRMLNIHNRPQGSDDGKEKVAPMTAFGIKAMSMGFFMPEDAPMVWRGPMVGMAIEQLLRDVDWGELDYLVVDLPPGTGDAQLTLSQKVPITGVVIVSTPQDVALADVKKGINMFRKVDAPVLGVIENMSFYVCPDCGHRAEIFSHGGARREAEASGIAFLGEIPLTEAIRANADAGQPMVVAEPDHPQSLAYKEIAAQVAARIATLQRRKSVFPNIVVE